MEGNYTLKDAEKSINEHVQAIMSDLAYCGYTSSGQLIIEFKNREVTGLKLIGDIFKEKGK